MSAPPVKQLALEQGVSIYQPDKLKAAEWQPVFAALKADAYVVVAYGKILPQWLLDLPRLGAYNVHASLLPKYRGAAPIHWAIANGETKTGITTMKLDAGMDTGDLLLQQEIPIEPEDTCASIHDRLAEIGAELMLKTLEDLEKGTAKPIPQDPALATYAPMLKKSDGLLDWSQSAVSLHNRIRAFNPWPGTYTQLQAQTLRVWKAQPAEALGRFAAARNLAASQFRSSNGCLWNRIPATRRGANGEPQAHFGSRFSPRHSLGKNPIHTLGKVSVPVSPARLAAFRILLRVQREESYASELLHSSLTDSLQENDLRLATELIFGTLRQQRLLDHVLASCSAKALARLDAEVLAALRLGAYQILFLQRVPGHAAVHESVELVKSARLKSAAGFVNAVLRKVANSDLERTRKYSTNRRPRL